MAYYYTEQLLTTLESLRCLKIAKTYNLTQKCTVQMELSHNWGFMDANFSINYVVNVENRDVSLSLAVELNLNVNWSIKISYVFLSFVLETGSLNNLLKKTFNTSKWIFLMSCYHFVSNSFIFLSFIFCSLSISSGLNSPLVCSCLSSIFTLLFRKSRTIDAV